MAHETKMLLPTIFDDCVDTEMYIYVRSRNNDGVKTGMFRNFYVGVNECIVYVLNNVDIDITISAM